MNLLKDSQPILKGIPVFSNVPDLAPFFEEADFMVYPIFSGSGMKVKTCEALMYGKNILGSSETFEGYELNISSCGRLCNTAEDYLKAIRFFSKNPVPKYNIYSRSVFVNKYSEDKAKKTFEGVSLIKNKDSGGLSYKNVRFTSIIEQKFSNL